jgi:hypothetical protein
VTVGLTVVYDAASLFSREEEVLSLLRMTFPGLEAARVAGDSPQGRALIAQHSLRLLPAYVFDARAVDAANFERMSKMFQRSGAAYVFDAERAGSTVRVGRDARPGALDIYLSPTSPHACTVARDALGVIEGMTKRPKVAFHYLVRDADGTDAPGGRFDAEEVARKVVVRALFPDRYAVFLKLRC